jgi:hypothetical protein
MGLSTLYFKRQQGDPVNATLIGGSSQIGATFTVAPADSGGLGITGLSSYQIANVYMHTSATPAVGNPNPAAGLILVQFSKAFQGFNKIVMNGPTSPGSGTNVAVTAGLTVGGLYQITVVGTTTAAQWQALGLPVGVVPAVGAVFIATSASAGVGTGQVQVPLSSGVGIDHIELFGNPVVTGNPSSGNAYVALICRAAGVQTAPATGSLLNLGFSVAWEPGPLI